jgi:hypothetical protein
MPHIEHCFVVKAKATGGFVYRHTVHGIADYLFPYSFTVMRTANRTVRGFAK